MATFVKLLTGVVSKLLWSSTWSLAGKNWSL